MLNLGGSDVAVSQVAAPVRQVQLDERARLSQGSQKSRQAVSRRIGLANIQIDKL